MPHALHLICHLNVFCNLSFAKRNMNNENHPSKVCDDKRGVLSDVEKESTTFEETSDRGGIIQPSKQKYKCKVCDKMYRHKADLKRHRQTHVKESRKCSQCPAAFSSQVSLANHVVAKHSSGTPDVGEHFLAQLILPDADENQEEETCEVKSDSLAEENINRYQCETCDTLFRDKKTFDKHKKQHLEPPESADKPKGYPCDICEERFRDKRGLERHIRQHSKPHVCVQCKARFATDSELKEHASKHENLKQYTCDICNQVYSSGRNLKRHQSIHSSLKQLNCPVCKRDFSSDQTLALHMKKHEETTCNDCSAVFDTEEELVNHVCTLQCKFCMEMFASKATLEDHMLHLHATEVKEEQEDEFQMDESEVLQSREVEEFQNSGSNERSNNEDDANGDKVDGLLDDDDNDTPGDDHDSAVSDDQMDDDDNLEAENGISEDESEPADSTPLCIACGTSFHTPKDLKLHMMEHASKRSFSCLKCNKNFTNLTNLRRHLQHHEKNTCKMCGLFFLHAKSLEIHDCGYTPYCNICHRPFNSKREYRLHMSTHGIKEEDEKNECYSCTDCGKTFAKFMNFRAHRANHTGEKPFVCRDCGEGFLSATALRIHRRTHTGKTYFSCQQCDATFVYEFKLKQHLLTHKSDEEMPFHCPHCQQGFVAKSGLLRHEVVCQSQSEENKEGNAEAMRKQRLYNRSKVGKNPNKKCHECGETFLRYDQFLLHMRTHNEKAELPLQCTYCPKGFVHEYNRKQHERFCIKRSAEEREERLEKEKDYNLYKTFKGQKVFKCTQCKQMFRYRHKFLLHQETHKSDIEKKYHCPLCFGGFVSRSGLKRHGMHCEKRSQQERGQRQEKKMKKATLLQKASKRRGEEEKTLWCADCGEGFTAKQDLSSHKLSCAKAAKPEKKDLVPAKSSLKDFVCPICTRVFHFSHILKLHMDAHNGIFPFQCKKCSRGFTLKSSFLLHKCLETSSSEHEAESTSLV